jgi:ubiquinone biosynthesis protein
VAGRAVVIAGHLAVAAPAALVGTAAVRVRRGRAAAGRYLARYATRSVVRLGPTFVKAGQVLATRRDVLPAVLCDELSTLHDSMPSLATGAARAALVRAYGAGVDDVFQHIDPEPIASGSIACVYRAVLSSGAEVAVKLRRPGIAARMAADLALVRHGAGLLARLKMFRGVPVRELTDQLCDSVLGQLDFERESAGLDLLRTNLSGVPRVRVPALLRAVSRDTSIVMEYLPDLRVDTAAGCPVVLRRAFAAAAMTVIYQMLFVDGFVHCDLHPGNLYFTRSGEVVVLDAGFSVQLTDRIRRAFADFFLNMSIGRGRRCAQVVIDSSLGLSESADVESFTAGLADLVRRSSGAAARDFSLMAFATELFDLQRTYGVCAAPEFVFPLLALLVIEGTIRDLDPDIDFQAVARPVLTRAVFGA